MEHTDLPGWRVQATHFDHGTQWGVGIDNGATGPDRRRHALRIPDGTLSREAAIEMAIPMLQKWAAE